MSSTRWRKDGRYIVDNPEIGALENFALETELRKQPSQTSSTLRTPERMSVEITQSEPIRTTEGLGDSPAPPRISPELPSEIVRVCINGREAEMRVYGGVIRFLD